MEIKLNQIIDWNGSEAKTRPTTVNLGFVEYRATGLFSHPDNPEVKVIGTEFGMASGITLIIKETEEEIQEIAGQTLMAVKRSMVQPPLITKFQ